MTFLIGMESLKREACCQVWCRKGICTQLANFVQVHIHTCDLLFIIPALRGGPAADQDYAALGLSRILDIGHIYP